MKKTRKFLSVLSAAAITASLLAVPVSAAEEGSSSLMDPPIVEVEQGALMGYMDGDTYAFLGVPYATAERFEMPEAPESWEGVRSAQAYGLVSPIPDATSVGDDEMVWPHRYWIQGEDCQNLNIWTQSIDPEAKKPVLVFFHGGGYTNGSSIESAAYEGANLSEYGDVVVVTVNHRLNVLGFLDLSAYGEEYEDSANVGIADLIASLQWIQDNIEVFGGDPDNVTIFGQSGGGGKVLDMLHAESAEGLVDKVIVESGSFSLQSKEVTQAVAAKTLENLGLDETQVDELKTIPYDDLIEAGTAALNAVAEETGTTVRWTPSEGNLLQADYCEWADDVPIMVGSVFSEQTSTFRVGDGRHLEWTEDEIDDYLIGRLGDGIDTEAIEAEFAEVFPDMHESDVVFYAPTNRQTVEKTLATRLESSSAPVYSYLFTYEAPVNGGTSAFHCSELIYAFHNVDIPVVSRATGGSDNEDAHTVQDTVATAWINFATTGDPSQDGLEWLPYTLEEPNVMRLDVESSCGVLGDDTLIELMTAK
jgi:para-nitrobenzyl esterase